MKAAIIDTETTGLLKHPSTKPELQPRIIEFGCVIVEDGKIKGKGYSQLIYPDEEVTEEITRITGITNDMLKGQPTFDKVYKKINAVLAGCDAIVAHNLPFDSGMLVREFALINKPLALPKIQLCTVQENMSVYGYRIKQKDLYEKVMGKKQGKAHRALDDCLALAEIVIKAGYLEGCDEGIKTR